MYNYIKRFFDLIFSLILITLLSPAILLVTIILKLSAEGEIFYLQERVGFKNCRFPIYKFATMLKDSLNMGTGSITLKDDYRVTKPGKFLRKSKLNEVPQLLNIMRGDLSFVGPRPILYQDYLLYSKEVQSEIYSVKPGLTGIGSIVFRDEEDILSSLEKNTDPFKYYQEKIAPYKGELERWYRNNISFLTDLKILIITVWTVINPGNELYLKAFKNLPKKIG